MQPPDGAPVYLQIKKEKQVEVFIDGTCFGEATSLKDAFLYGVAAFAVFNLSYPTAMAKTFLFVEKAVFNIEDCTTERTKKQQQITKAVESFIAKVNGMVNKPKKASADPKKASTDPKKVLADPEKAPADPERASADPEKVSAEPPK